jgi:hypothetical protein
MMQLLMAILPVLFARGTQAASFGGAGLGFAGEADHDGTELLLDFSMEPVKMVHETREDTWARAHLAFGFLADEDRIDRIDGTVLVLRRGLEKGQVHYDVRFGDAFWDQDIGVVEVTPAGGRLDVLLAGEYLHLVVGADVYGRQRWILVGSAGDIVGSPAREHQYGLFLGIPLGVRLQTSASRPLGASLGLVGRPGIGLVASDRVIFDGDARAEGSYTLVQGEDMSLVAALSADLHVDTWTSYEESSVVGTLMAGMSVKF